MKKIGKWLKKESPVMWVPWFQFIIMYFMVLPVGIIGIILIYVGACAALSGDIRPIIAGVILIIVAGVVGLITESVALREKNPPEP